MDSRSGSITPNSMIVLERGAGGVSTLVGPAASRPPSGRRSRPRTPIQRSGSQLEVLPLTGDEKMTASDKPSSFSSSRPGSTEDSGRRTHSAGSSRSKGQMSRQGQTGDTPSKGLSRAESLDSGISPREGSSSRPGSAIHKQVSLTTVKRNYEMHGVPKNESYDFVPKDVSDIASTLLTNGTIPSTGLVNTSTGTSGSASCERVAGLTGAAEKGGNGDGVNVMSEQEVAQQRLDYLMEQLSTKNNEIRRHEERREPLDANKNKDSEDRKELPSAAVLRDAYYVSTGSLPTTQAGASDDAQKAPPFLEDKEDGEVEEDSGDDDDEEEGPKAPIELMSEFLDAVMEEEYETADKLCKMILIYEPENPECLQFKPLIEEMLKREWHAQLWGSSSEGESGDDDDDGEENDDDNEDDEEDDDDDSDEDSSESDSSEESNDEDEEEGGKESSASVLFQNGQET